MLEADSKPAAQDGLGNRLWHTDASFRAVPGDAVDALCARRAGRAGKTEFADLRAAYDALPDVDKDATRRSDRRAFDLASRGQLGFTNCAPEKIASLPPVPQRVVRTHPGSGRKTLYSPRTPRHRRLAVARRPPAAAAS